MRSREAYDDASCQKYLYYKMAVGTDWEMVPSMYVHRQRCSRVDRFLIRKIMFLFS
jgi:hypothetical protein